MNGLAIDLARIDNCVSIIAKTLYKKDGVIVFDKSKYANNLFLGIACTAVEKAIEQGDLTNKQFLEMLESEVEELDVN